MAKKTITGFQEGLSGLINSASTGTDDTAPEQKKTKVRGPVIQKKDNRAPAESKDELIGIFEESREMKIGEGFLCSIDEEYGRILLRAAGAAGIKVKKKQVVNAILRQFIRKYKSVIQELISLETNNIDNI